ncbi:MAG: carboxypeptidase regulatory-like domain-containing protein [Thermogutta sp.]|uniref:carboxypeptidase-like regulatory domain-containing protein n=1 Tax=Thermogutta sp. TaxID=1962930 RepID=UPI00199DDEB0|nr:carboxypeptidase-like regulatory domain-containing protein [Thermogutta sp.]MBC7353154.1 carboxypeptidase regulatory-like domain-containing protein [Thermogutta sp.]
MLIRWVKTGGTSLALLVAFLALPGCGKKSPLPLVKTTGQLMYKGQPVADASVMLSPLEGQRAAVGKTDAQGRFELTTMNPRDGAMPGKYKIVITKATAVEAAADAAEMPDITKEQALAKPAPAAIPAKYSNPNTTPLECTIPQSGRHDLGVLELTD